MKNRRLQKFVTFAIAFLLIFSSMDLSKSNIYAESNVSSLLNEDENEIVDNNDIIIDIDDKLLGESIIEDESIIDFEKDTSDIKVDEHNNTQVKDKKVIYEELDVQLQAESNIDFSFIKTEYFTGSEVSLDLKLNVLPGEMKDGDTVKLFIPKEYVDKNSIYLQTSIIGNLPVMTEDQENFILEYNLLNVKNGFNGTYPYRFKTFDGTTPEGEISVRLEVTKNGVVEAIDRSTHLINTRPTLTKMIKDSSNNLNDGNPIIKYKLGKKSTINVDYLTDNLLDLDILTFTFNLETPFEDKGNRTYEKLEIVDTLPEYAYFDPAINQGWELSDDGTTVSYTLMKDIDLSIAEAGNFNNEIELKLKFPSARISKTLTNKINVLLTPKDSQASENIVSVEDDVSFIVNHDVTCAVSSKVLRNNRDRYDSQLDRDENFHYTSRLKNTSQTKLKNISVIESFITGREEFDIPNPLIYEKLSFENGRIPNGVGDLKIELTFEDKTVRVIGPIEVTSDTEVDFRDYNQLGNKIERMTLIFSEGLFLNPNSEMSYHLYKSIESPNDKIIPSNQNKADFYSRARFNYSFESEGLIDEDCQGSQGYTFTAGATFLNPLLEIENTRVSSSNTIISIIDASVDYKLSLSAKNLSRYVDTPILDDLVVMTTLPVGVKFLPGSTSIQLGNRVDQIDIDLTPKVISKTDGTSLLQWNIPAFKIKSENGRDANLININYKTTLSYEMERGINESVATIEFDKNNTFNVEEGKDQSTATFNYQPGTEGSFWVQSSDQSSSNFNYDTTLEKGKEFKFKYSIRNTTGEPMTDSMGLVFVPDNAKLVNQVLVNGDYLIEYTTKEKEKNTSEKDYYNNSNIWSSNVNDYSEVKAFKVSLNGNNFDTGELIELTAQYQLKDINEDCTNVNSNIYVALRSSSQLSGSNRSNVNFETESFTVNKQWIDGNNQDGVRPSRVQINLLANGNVVKNIELDATNEWRHLFENLPIYNNEEIIEYSISENKVLSYETEYQKNGKNDFTVKNTHKTAIKDLTVDMIWNDENNQDGIRPTNVVVKLLADGKETGQNIDLSKNNNWSSSFNKLPVNKDGVEIVYTISYETMPEGYTTDETLDTNTNLFVITNEYEPKVKDLTVDMIWNDENNQDGIRPSNVVVKLLADDKETGQNIDLSKINDWSSSFNKLPVNKDGVEIVYTINYETMPEGYSTSEVFDSNSNTYTITLNYTPATTSTKVTVEWEDYNNKYGVRPEVVEFMLYANGIPVKSNLKVSSFDNWLVVINELALMSDGKEIDYVITQENVDGYTTVISGNVKDGFVITNKYKINTQDNNDNEDKSSNVKPDLPTTGHANFTSVWSLLFIVSVVILIAMKKKFKLIQ